MESVSDGHVQMEENDGTQLSPACLCIPLIIRKILVYCSNSELLQLSLVNKQWNYEARSVIKDRGTMNAHLRPHIPRKGIAAFASHVQQMNVVPYSGICVYFDQDQNDEDFDSKFEGCSSEALYSSIDAILNRLPLKNFEVLFGGEWQMYERYAGSLLVKKILQDQCGVLESLNVGLPQAFESFLGPTIEYSSFPRLKTLKVGNLSQHSSSGAVRKFIMEIISRAPNLQELHLDHPLKGFKDLEGSSAVLVIDSEMDPFNGGISEGLIGALRQRRMRLDYKPAGRDFSMRRFNRIVPVVLQSSSSTLHSLSFDSVFAPSLMRYGIQLGNVSKLKMELDGSLEHDVPQRWAPQVSTFLRILQDFDFTRIFPKLNEVEVTSSQRIRPREIRKFIEQGNIISPSPDRAVKIKHLRLNYSTMSLPFLATMFPHIERLSIENWNGPVEPPFGLIWEHWVNLKQFAVHAQGVWRENLDSLFCGLFPEEIAQLTEEDDEYLKAVNIVPVMPSITCMKDLRSFTLSNTGNGFVVGGVMYPSFMLSKVTALIAFSRCPNLSVTLEIYSKWENAWSHMKKYASIVIVK